MLADTDPSSTYKRPSPPNSDRPPPTHFQPIPKAAKPPQKPATRRKAEPPQPVGGSLMTCKEVAAVLHISEKALEHLRRRGTGPKHVSIGGTGRSVRYRAEDLNAYPREKRESAAADSVKKVGGRTTCNALLR